jgi:hypothetical protein
MSRRLKIGLISIGGLLVLAALAAVFALRALGEVQPFYAEAMRVAPKELESAGRQMESRVTALVSEAQPPGRWQTVFTDDEVNGWLAVTLKEKFSELLPPEVSDPRVVFTDGGCKIGFRYDGEQLSAVISVEGDASIASEDVAAVRLRRAFLGGLPLPMSEVVDEITAIAAKLQLPIRWAHQDGDPILLAPVTNALSTERERRQLERLELRNGQLLLAGRTSPRPSTTASPDNAAQLSGVRWAPLALWAADGGR